MVIDLRNLLLVASLLTALAFVPSVEALPCEEGTAVDRAYCLVWHEVTSLRTTADAAKDIVCDETPDDVC